MEIADERLPVVRTKEGRGEVRRAVKGNRKDSCCDEYVLHVNVTNSSTVDVKQYPTLARLDKILLHLSTAFESITISK